MQINVCKQNVLNNILLYAKHHFLFVNFQNCYFHILSSLYIIGPELDQWGFTTTAVLSDLIRVQMKNLAGAGLMRVSNPSYGAN